MVDPIDAVKQIYNAVEKYNDVPLMRQIVDLQSQVVDLQAELFRTKRELLELSEKLNTRAKMTRRGPANFYYLEGETDPLCPICWERDGKTIHLPQQERFPGGISRVCNVCRTEHWEVPLPKYRSDE